MRARRATTATLGVRGRFRLTAVVLAVLIAVGWAAPAAKAVPVAPAPAIPLPPEMDPGFYDPALSEYADLEPGEILKARRVNVATYGVIPVNVDTWQLSYRSTNTRGEPVAAVTTILTPRGNQADRPLVSFQMAEDSLAQYCAPSYAVQQWSVPPPITGSQAVGAEFLAVQAALAQGWAVNVPDYQGPDSAYAAGPLHARLILDSIRAVKSFNPAQVAGSQVGLMGYSGGAIATGHTAELQPEYAPEIQFAGVVSGGMPADLEPLLLNANSAAPSGLILGAVFGLGREYPEFQTYLERNLNPLGRFLMDVKSPLCVAYQAALLPFGNNIGLIDRPNPMRDPEVRKVLADTKMGQRVPTAPMFIYHSNPDWVVPVGQMNRYVAKLCADPNAQVEYVRDHFSEHLTMEVSGTPSALMWLGERFAGKPAKPGCSTTDVGSLALNDDAWPNFARTVGDVLAGIFGKALGRDR